MDKTKIDLCDLAKINHLQMEIFEEEDTDYPDYEAVKDKEIELDYILSNITNDKTEQLEISDACTKHLFNTSDITFKPICDDLRSKGYIIISKNNEN